MYISTDVFGLYFEFYIFRFFLNLCLTTPHLKLPFLSNSSTESFFQILDFNRSQNVYYLSPCITNPPNIIVSYQYSSTERYIFIYIFPLSVWIIDSFISWIWQLRGSLLLTAVQNHYAVTVGTITRSVRECPSGAVCHCISPESYILQLSDAAGFSLLRLFLTRPHNIIRELSRSGFGVVAGRRSESSILFVVAHDCLSTWLDGGFSVDVIISQRQLKPKLRRFFSRRTVSTE